MIIDIQNIEILPFDGQGQSSAAAPSTEAKLNTKAANPIKTKLQAERKQVSRPTGKLTTTNLGINSTLNPKVNTEDQAIQDQLSQQKEPFTFEDLERVWKNYCLKIKRERKDSLYSTLTSSPMTMSSDYVINLDISNTVQGAELERDKIDILGFIRKELKNGSVTLTYKQIEQERMQVFDTKANFDKLANENPSLDKFRKLFNLDIEM
ncbi:hypothetical protein [Crocinitomix catalasitica]|uniref:hypothetical protein n=1 Tax=Crocinitomix catalasitica TaxID=184607 RepID=UPI0004825C75|nr:hypothetical protein [Crocinitomix catalasitica]